jgi:hypothetical protein
MNFAQRFYAIADNLPNFAQAFRIHFHAGFRDRLNFK